MRKGAALLLLLAASAVASEPLSEPRLRQAAALCRRAERALGRGDAARAAGLFDRALAAAPDYPDARIGLGWLALGDGRDEEALGHFRAAREAHGRLGRVLDEIRARRYRDVQDEIRHVQETLADLARVHRAGLDGTGMFEAADKFAKLRDRLQALQAVELPRPGTVVVPAELWFHEGMALFRLGRFDGAGEAWRACAAQNPGFGAVHVNLAVLAWKAGRFDDARRSLRDAEARGWTVEPRMLDDLAAAEEAARR